MEPVPSAVEAWSFNHWTTREVQERILPDRRSKKDQRLPFIHPNCFLRQFILGFPPLFPTGFGLWQAVTSQSLRYSIYKVGKQYFLPKAAGKVTEGHLHQVSNTHSGTWSALLWYFSTSTFPK